MVGCETYMQCFTSPTLSEMNNCLNGGTHGPVHILVGGEWDDPEEEFIAKTGVFFRVAIFLLTWFSLVLRFVLRRCFYYRYGSGMYASVHFCLDVPARGNVRLPCHCTSVGFLC